jgi:hypothetical protein
VASLVVKKSGCLPLLRTEPSNEASRRVYKHFTPDGVN